MITFKIRWFTLQDTNFVTKLAKKKNCIHSMILNIFIFGRTESFLFPFLSQGIFGEKPFPKFLKPFPHLESDWQKPFLLLLKPFLVDR